MSQYIYTDLPKYVKTTPRENFSNSVVKSGSALIFSEDGENLVAKLPDGTFKEIGGGSAEYYKCASVNTSSHTWTGYKAVMTDGIYTFESTVTQGLAYTSTTPKVGKIYSADALVQVAYMAGNIPESGLVFYAPLTSNKSTAETGQELTYNSTGFFSVVEGIPCMRVSSTEYITIYDISNIPTGSSVRTYSLWAKTEETTNRFSMFGYGASLTNAFIMLKLHLPNQFVLNYFGSSDFVRTLSIGSGWHHYCLTYDQTTVRLFFDGSLVKEEVIPLETNLNYNPYLKIGTIPEPHSYNEVTGYIAGVRVYNRNLGEVEIAALYNEFEVTET